MIVYLTGASGVGKTSIVEQLKKENTNPNVQFHNFDGIEIPELENSEARANWQEQATHYWINTILKTYQEKDLVIFEGSSSFQFIFSAFKKNNFENFLVILIDCEEAIMTKRLIENRNQPELVNDDMKNWLRILRQQAQEQNIFTIDTSAINVHQAIELLWHQIDASKK